MRQHIYIKHFMHSAKDLPITYEFDPINLKIKIESTWIDTLLLQRFLQMLIKEYNDELGKTDRSEVIVELSNFEITLAVADKVVYELQLIERAFEPKEPTLVMRIKE